MLAMQGQLTTWLTTPSFTMLAIKLQSFKVEDSAKHDLVGCTSNNFIKYINKTHKLTNYKGDNFKWHLIKTSLFFKIKFLLHLFQYHSCVISWQSSSSQLVSRHSVTKLYQ